MTDQERKNLVPGDRVIVLHDDGSEKTHTVERSPWTLYGPTMILGLSGVTGGYLLNRVVRKIPTTPIDSKYGRVTVENKTFHPDEPVFLLRATDPLTVKMVREYAERCVVAGCDATHVADAFAHAHRIEAWQQANPALVKKRPD